VYLCNCPSHSFHLWFRVGHSAGRVQTHDHGGSLVCQFVSYLLDARQTSVIVDQVLAAVCLIYERDPLRAMWFTHKDNLGAALGPINTWLSISVLQWYTALAVVQVAVSHTCILEVRWVLCLELAHACKNMTSVANHFNITLYSEMHSSYKQTTQRTVVNIFDY
jgi:hypothetical protein